VLQLDEAVSDALTSGESGVFGASSVSLLLGVVLSQGVDTNLSSHVELISDGSSSDVEPVWVIRSKVLIARCFIISSPLWNSNLVSLLEELSVLLNELFGWHVLDGDTLLVVNAIQLDLQVRNNI